MPRPPRSSVRCSFPLASFFRIWRAANPSYAKRGRSVTAVCTGGTEPLRQRYILIQPYPSADIDEDLTLAAMTSVALGVPFGS